MNDTVLKLKLLAKTEVTLARIQARRTAGQAIYIAVALFFVLLGLGMLNYASYQILVTLWSPALAALTVAVIDMALGALILRIAFISGQTGEEEKMAQEIRDMILVEISADVDTVKKEFSKITDDVSRIRSRFSSFGGNNRGTIAELIPLLELLIKAIRRQKKTRELPRGKEMSDSSGKEE
ncbi:phage holin family protein [Desulfopila sp. IMCC35008]|uniref:phage holin family protein n=1 Tax=Desulfopila sp. IMCC35008 TaxID=2653858 RepID=UPI0013D536A0|nr:phage holin family protein [Desulfopila sp. IMCC35008]